MKYKWANIALVFGLTTLLLVLGALQWRWQSQISDSEREKMHKRVQEEVSRFSEDFNKEIQNAYFNFQIDAGEWQEKNYRPFVERYEFWRNKTNYPTLISDFYFFDPNGQNAPLKYDRDARMFTAVGWTPELHDLQKRAAEEKSFRAVYEDIYTLVLPEYERPPKMRAAMIRRKRQIPETSNNEPEPQTPLPTKFGYLIIRLDPEVLKNGLLPDLASRYFGEGDYNLAVTDRDNAAVFQTGAAVTTADARAGLFDLSPNDLFFFADRDLVNSIGERHENVMMNHVESRTMSRTEVNNGSTGTVKVEVQRGNRTGPKTQVFTTKTDGPPARWTLAAQHAAGSIDAYIVNTKFRNLSTGFGILALLGLSAAAIIFSAQRAKRFAQRQVDFVSSVSHEFRTPLAVIYTAGENLADGVTNEPVQTSKYGELIKGEGRKLSAMVEQILEFAGSDSGRRKYSFRDTSIADIVNDALAECRPLIDEHRIVAETDVDTTLPIVNADAESLSRAIQNLIANSVKYRNGSNWLRVSARNGDGAVKISVEDRGIGISKSDLRHVFEPFYRSKAVVDAQIHGNGLGLALVKQIAEAHGGRVTAESEVGKGSVFTIEIPMTALSNKQ